MARLDLELLLALWLSLPACNQESPQNKKVMINSQVKGGDRIGIAPLFTWKNNYLLNAQVAILQKIPTFVSLSLIIAGLCIGIIVPADVLFTKSDFGISESESMNFGLLLDGYDEWEFIFKNNMMVCFNLLLGVLTLGFSSSIQLIWTGCTVSWVVQSTMLSGTSGQKIMALILPHGLIELGGFTMVGAVSFEGFIMLYHKLRYDEWSFDNERMILIMKRITAGILLILMASIIETYVTGLISAKIK